MRIVEIREKTVSIASAITNAYIDFSKMTCSVVALITDVERDGKRVIGYGFNSNGRYGQGQLMRNRFFPRLQAADPNSLADETGANLDPFRIWATLMKNEKPGGHGERSVAVGTIDMAVWDAVAKIAGKPLYRLLAERYRGGKADSKVFVYAAGGYYYPGKDMTALQKEMQGYLDLGYQVVKMKIGGVPLDEDIAAYRSRARSGRRGRSSWRSTPMAGSIWRRRSPTARPCDRTACSGTKKQAIPLDYALQAELAEVLPVADGDGRKSVFATRTPAICSATAG